MKKIISYRQTLIELARIYKIDKVFDQDLKHTTYDIELILLKNKVPLPSRKSYFTHKITNEVLKPFYQVLRKVLKVNIKQNKYLTFFYGLLRKKVSININPNKYLNKFFYSIKDGVENYFNFVISNIVNFFKILSKTVIDVLNDVYNFKVKEKLIKNLFSKSIYASLVALVIFSGIYINGLITDVDSLKISLEIKSDKKIDDKKLKEKKKETVKVLKNNSKNLAKLPKEKKSTATDDNFNLNTQTVLNLFEDLEYDLDQVRNKKKVKPIYFTRLPKDLDTIKSVKEKKETFLQILLPLVVAENEKIEEDRKYLLKLLKDNESEESKKWLNKKYKSYRVSSRNIKELIEKIDIIPTSIALAQAAKESGWGTSRFALEGNAIYGQWTWTGEGIEPLEKTEEQSHKILKFPLLRASVKAYINNLNTHAGYKSFRVKRAELREQNKKLAGLELIHELKNYAQTGTEYTKILEKIIKQNDLDQLETVTIDDFKESNQLKL
ncbi:glucosaminidase domain-containing protein [Pelagibacteraceae bacterium]|nr:glucosaminidase domain-containing protein [Pelagibacteraceae bacterium]